MQTLIIEVSGGVVQEVYSDSKDLRIILVDWDAGERPGDAFTGGSFLPQPTSAVSRASRAAVQSFGR